MESDLGANQLQGQSTDGDTVSLRAEAERMREREAATREILEVISESRDNEQPVFETILENASRLCNAPLAFLSLANAERTNVLIPAHRGTRSEFGSILDGFIEPISRTELVAVRPIADGQIVREDDIRDDETYRKGDPRRRQMVDVEGARSVLGVPLVQRGKPLGAIILYRREVQPFTADDVSLIESFAAQAVIAIENVRQFKALENLNAELGNRVEEQVGELERMGRLKRFLPSAVADTVISQGSDELLSSHRALLGVLFCDIRGFTAFCETAEPEETIEILQTYHEEMGKLINAHGAGVDHRMGDGIMVLFNDPLPCDDPAGDAVRLAIAMRARMAELSMQWKRLGYRLVLASVSRWAMRRSEWSASKDGLTTRLQARRSTWLPDYAMRPKMAKSFSVRGPVWQSRMTFRLNPGERST